MNEAVVVRMPVRWKHESNHLAVKNISILSAWIAGLAVYWAALLRRLIHAASQVDARLDTARARIGDRLTLTLTAHSGRRRDCPVPRA